MGLFEVSLSVRELVEFVLAQGSIDRRGGSDQYQRANEGARLHRKLQKQAKERYREAYRSEVSLCKETKEDGICYRIFGRADAVLQEENGVVVEEIKTIETPLSSVSDNPDSAGYRPLHWAQAKCYAYLLCCERQLTEICVQLIYCQTETEETVSFVKQFSCRELEGFYDSLLQRYRRWAKREQQWQELLCESAKSLAFPFPEYRKGQRQMAAVVYRCAVNRSRAFCQAPTGIGKTISSLFPAVKAMGEGKLSHIFYLTAKTSTRAVAEDSFLLMEQRGLRCKRVTLTAKEKICFLEEPLCNPDDCPYAKDYYDRAPDTIFQMLSEEDCFSREVIERWARENRLCPFELGLDLSVWCNAVICDYNYLFDPVVYLKRFFDKKGEYCFLIDEAHNLPDRARAMYSAQIKKSDALLCKKLCDSLSKPLKKSVSDLNQVFLTLKKECLSEDSAREKEHFCCKEEIPQPLLKAAWHFLSCCSEFLEERRRATLPKTLFDTEPEQSVPKELLQLYFDIRFFLQIAEWFDRRFTCFISVSGAEVTVKLLCLDPAEMVDRRLKLGRCAVLFSATLSPPSYYKAVLGCDETDSKTNSYALPSPFPQENLCSAVCPQINARWAKREESLEPIARILYRMTQERKGNYLAYFPSYQYLQQEAQVFARLFPELPLLLQSPQASDEEREEFLRQFDSPHSQTSLLGFAVLGGIYSEGIDFKGEKLLGTAVIGTGLPRVGAQQEILKEYYDKKYQAGFDYAYRYPGMNKVLQAAGRVIRSMDDRGVVLFLDDRFSLPAYRRLFPPHWNHTVTANNEQELTQILSEFWKEKNCGE